MPAIQRSEFALALNQVSNERGLDPAIVLETVQNAILAAYRKDHPEAELEEFRAELNANTGEAKIFHKDEDVTPPGFGRIAAQTAKQVILQKIREKEKETIISDFRQRIGTIVNGMVLRFAGPNVIVDIGKTEAIMPPNEQIVNEKYHLNQRLTVYIVEIKEGLRGEEVVVSRAANGLLEGLFKREVPEVAQGAVEIKSIEREPGNRSKVAVYSNQSGIDPVGSCVGQKGVRVQAIIAEFNGIEKIDIIQWQEAIEKYVQAALSPAKQLTVKIDEDEKLAKVKVAPEELSLAIGKDGQNVRLASKLTGYRIEIEGDEKLSAIPQEEAKPKEEVDKEKASKEPKGKEKAAEAVPAAADDKTPTVSEEVKAEEERIEKDIEGQAQSESEETMNKESKPSEDSDKSK
ncbi:MAG: transcription termination factor NusA [Candidatus Levybacteria bacterium]|nr:transcription termination factor NusA [Candidatus Levybacteria bacterium]